MPLPLVAGAGELALGRHLHQRQPVRRRVVLRRRGRRARRHRLEVERLAGRGLRLRRIDQPVAADPDAVGGLGQIGHQVAPAVVGDDDLHERRRQIARLGDDPDAGLGSGRAGHRAAPGRRRRWRWPRRRSGTPACRSRRRPRPRGRRRFRRSVRIFGMVPSLSVSACDTLPDRVRAAGYAGIRRRIAQAVVAANLDCRRAAGLTNRTAASRIRRLRDFDATTSRPPAARLQAPCAAIGAAMCRRGDLVAPRARRPARRDVPGIVRRPGDRLRRRAGQQRRRRPEPAPRADGSARLTFEGRAGYLASALDALQLPVDSQLLLYSQGQPPGPDDRPGEPAGALLQRPRRARLGARRRPARGRRSRRPRRRGLLLAGAAAGGAAAVQARVPLSRLPPDRRHAGRARPADVQLDARRRRRAPRQGGHHRSAQSGRRAIRRLVRHRQQLARRRIVATRCRPWPAAGREPGLGRGPLRPRRLPRRVERHRGAADLLAPDAHDQPADPRLVGGAGRRPGAASGRRAGGGTGKRGRDVDARHRRGSRRLHAVRRRSAAAESGARRVRVRRADVGPRAARPPGPVALPAGSRPAPAQVPVQLPDLLAGVRRAAAAGEGARSTGACGRCCRARRASRATARCRAPIGRPSSRS